MSAAKSGAEGDRRPGLALLVSALVPRSDGYPHPGKHFILSHDMERQRAMDALNQPGLQQPSNRVGHHRLLPGRTLVVRALKSWCDRTPVRLQRRQTDVLQTRDELTGDCSIPLVPLGDPTNPTVALDHRDDVDTSRIDWLPRYLPSVSATNKPAQP